MSSLHGMPFKDLLHVTYVSKVLHLYGSFVYINTLEVFGLCKFCERSVKGILRGEPIKKMGRFFFFICKMDINGIFYATDLSKAFSIYKTFCKSSKFRKLFEGILLNRYCLQDR